MVMNIGKFSPLNRLSQAFLEMPRNLSMNDQKINFFVCAVFFATITDQAIFYNEIF